MSLENFVTLQVRNEPIPSEEPQEDVTMGKFSSQKPKKPYAQPKRPIEELEKQLPSIATKAEHQTTPRQVI